MEKLKCTSCGGHLDVEENKEYAVCKHCGANNLVSDTVGKCKYCRQPLQ